MADVHHWISKWSTNLMNKDRATIEAAMPARDQHHPVSVKKIPLRELPKESTNIIMRSPGSSPAPKDSVLSQDTNGTAGKLASKQPPANSPLMDASRLTGTKRQQPSDSISSPSSLQPSSNNSTNGHLVYVRRKLDTELSKMTSTSVETNGADPLSLNKGSKARPDPDVPKTIALPATVPSKPFVGSAVVKTNSVVTNGMQGQVEFQSSGGLDWRERSIQLQNYLRSRDHQSSMEDYMRNLRSLSAAGRSKHAVELEKRAIQLFLEEGTELHRMKALNVLGKPLPKDNSPIETPSPSQMQHCKDESTRVRFLF